MNTKSILLVVAGLLVGFVAGAVIMVSPETGGLPGGLRSGDSLPQSGLIVSGWQATVKGKVMSVSESSITLTGENGESFLIPVTADTEVRQVVFANDGDGAQINPSSLQDIQEGNAVEVVITLAQDGGVVALAIYISEGQ
ncbi:MAG: hypothetical protein Q8P70_01150 [bacterium]|nr:hypothetical protein [bacterium]